MVKRTCIYLPEDFVRDILLRLPVKTLVPFRLVCKSWSALLKSHDFTTTHLNRSANHGCHLLVDSHGDEGESHGMGLISLDHHGAVKIETPEIGVENRGMVGSCNGLVCLYHGWRNITLWNPATREQWTLPSPRIDNKFYFTLMRAVGFGYHLNDYKVVRIEYSLEGPPVPTEVKVFCTSTDSWSVVDAIVPCFLWPHKCSVILEGVPYWLGFESFWKDEMYVRKEFVVCFDMGKEVFRQVHVPDAEGSYYDCSKKLGVLHESLAIIYYLRDEQVINFVDFWVMKDDECWSKVQRIGPFSNVGIPLGCWKDGVVVWQNGVDELFLYDPNTKAVNKLSIYGAPTCVFTYMETGEPSCSLNVRRKQKSVMEAIFV